MWGWGWGEVLCIRGRGRGRGPFFIHLTSEISFNVVFVGCVLLDVILNDVDHCFDFSF